MDLRNHPRHQILTRFDTFEVQVTLNHFRSYPARSLTFWSLCTYTGRIHIASLLITFVVSYSRQMDLLQMVRCRAVFLLCCEAPSGQNALDTAADLFIREVYGCDLYGKEWDMLTVLKSFQLLNWNSPDCRGIETVAQFPQSQCRWCSPPHIQDE